MPTRHKWDHFKRHHYLCLKCGTMKENILDGDDWRTMFYLPDGRKVFRALVPVCTPGRLTADRLARFAEIRAKIHAENKSSGSVDST